MRLLRPRAKLARKSRTSDFKRFENGRDRWDVREEKSANGGIASSFLNIENTVSFISIHKKGRVRVVLLNRNACA